MKETLGTVDYSEEKPPELAKKIRQQQLDCAPYVTALSLEEITDLLTSGNYFFAERDGEIIASMYKLPLLDSDAEEEQIYRLGGLSIKGYRNATDEMKKIFWNFLDQIRLRIERQNLQIIMKTENSVIARFLTKCGAEQLTYDECQQRYPNFLAAYISRSKKTDEYYKRQIFFVRGKK